MPHYFADVHYNDIIYRKDDLNFREFEGCSFTNCNFTECLFLDVTFIDCTFVNCNLNGTKVAHCSFRTVFFTDCTMRDVNFVMCDKLIFEIHFCNCTLDFSKFYTRKLNGSTFTQCSLVATDFMAADLTGIVFDRCDLYRSEFDQAIAVKANFATSFNYTIDPEKTKLKKALFSKDQVKGLLYRHELVIW